MGTSTALAACRCLLPHDGRASHAYLHALIENNPIAVLVLDNRHRFQMCNPAFSRLFQYEPSDLETWGIDSLIAGPDFLQEAGQATRAVLAGEQVRLLSKRRRRDGLLIDVEIHGVPLLLDGRVEGVYGLYQDVTERTQLADAMQAMTARLDSARDEERRRFARDLHDSLSQELALLNWNLNRLEKLLPQDAGDAAQVLRQTRELATSCGDQIRSVSFLLHPPQLGEVSLVEAIRLLVEGFERRSGIPVHLDLPQARQVIAMPLQAALYRVLQEALANILRHAHDSAVTVSLCRTGGRWGLTISNLLATPTQDPLSGQTSGVGLNSMRERLTEVGGSLELHTSAQGLRVLAEVPVCEPAPCG